MSSCCPLRSHPTKGFLIFVLIALTSVSCGVRRLVSSASDGGLLSPGDGPLTQGDGPFTLPDAPRFDGSELCNEPRAPLTRRTDPLENFTFAARPGLKIDTLHIHSSPRTLSAMTIDHPHVAAFALARPSTRTALELFTTLSRQLQAHGGFHATLRASGTPGTSAEGNPDIKEILWDIETDDVSDISSLRNTLLALTLDRPRGTLGSLPGKAQERARRFVWTLTLVAAPQQSFVSAALASRSTHDASVDADITLISDLANGTALAPSIRRILPTGCDRAKVVSQGKADILWVIDESGSMRDHREAIATHAASFFAKASAAGLDFRMGVTGMVQPGKHGAIAGKLCSTISSDPRDEGGEDRFLGPQERETFLSCVRNPPYEETSEEFGLAAILEGMRRHLPRAKSDPRRFRKDAKVAIVIVTDEAPQEVKIGSVYDNRDGFLEEESLGPDRCHLQGEDATQLQDYLAPWVGLLTGRADPEGRATVHLVGGLCGNGCKTEIPYGYRELVQYTRGRRADVCQRDISRTLQSIVDSIVATASPRRLSQRPISASLRVTANGVPLERSHRRGFRYSAASNTLSFVDVPVTLGTEIIVAYSLFE